MPMPINSYKYVIGIDLGTTNSAIAFAALSDQILKTLHPEGSPSPLLPSAIFLQKDSHAIGHKARELSYEQPLNGILSAKSWLHHMGAKADESFLPLESDWEKISPLKASALILGHIRDLWNKKEGEGEFEEQMIVISVPASFNEHSRGATLQAAKLAGLKNVTLLEEPLAAFYSYTKENDIPFKEGDTILVVDVGGGTTDFTLITQTGSGFSRQAVGEHILLGGDNMDLAVAHALEEKMNCSELPLTEWLKLKEEAKKAKEALLGKEKSRTVYIHGQRIIKDAKKAVITKEDMEGLIVEGFFPHEPFEAAALAVKSAGIKKWGLNYHDEPSIVRHLAKFLYSAKATPDYILFNGGVFKAETLQLRVQGILTDWFKKDIPILPTTGLDLGVAKGGATYGLAKLGLGQKIASGLARSFYLEVATPDGSKALTIAPKGSEEGSEKIIDLKASLKANTRALFPLWSSVTRGADPFLSLIDINHEDMVRDTLSRCFLKYGKQEADIPVQMKLKITEMGTLSLILASKTTPHEWKLEFETRELKQNSSEEILFDDAVLSQVKSIVIEAFQDSSGKKLSSILKRIEEQVGLAKKEFPPSLWRALWEPLKQVEGRRKASVSYEERWWNLAGLSLMPGTGYPMDDLRIQELWRILLSDSSINREKRIALRRVALGFSAGQQRQLAAPFYNLPEDPETVRLLASFELLEIKTKIKLAEKWLKNQKNDSHYWGLARLGSRRLLSGSLSQVIPAQTVSEWIKTYLITPSPLWVFVLNAWGRKTGIREIDLPLKLKKEIQNLYSEIDPLSALMYQEKMTNHEDQEAMFGDKLPLGLQI